MLLIWYDGGSFEVGLLLYEEEGTRPIMTKDGIFIPRVGVSFFSLMNNDSTDYSMIFSFLVLLMGAFVLANYSVLLNLHIHHLISVEHRGVHAQAF